jgi:hypothetical protein
LVRDFQRLLEQFQQIQERSVEKSKEFVVRAKAIKASESPIIMEEEYFSDQRTIRDEKAPLIGVHQSQQ